MNQNNNSNTATDLSRMAASAIAATSKTPFKTAFFLTLGIGAARAILFVGVIGSLALIFKVLFGG